MKKVYPMEKNDEQKLKEIFINRIDNLNPIKKEAVKHAMNDWLDHKTKNLLKDYCEALGWQGGTIHQVLIEIKRLKKLDRTCVGCKYNAAVTNIWNPDKCQMVK